MHDYIDFNENILQLLSPKQNLGILEAYKYLICCPINLNSSSVSKKCRTSGTTYKSTQHHNPKYYNPHFPHIEGPYLMQCTLILEDALLMNLCEDTE